jgi:hypothetical protein
MRPPYFIALAVIAIGLSLVKWWAGLAVLAWVAGMYVYYRVQGTP